MREARAAAMSRRYGGEASKFEAVAHRGGNVLVVDDQEENRILVAHYLTREGYRAKLAANGEEALAAIAEKAPDLILMDVVMPGANGFQLCRQLKSDPATLAIPIVLITGLQRRDDRIAGKEAGADDFLSKPVIQEELLARVNSLMRLAEARKALEEARLAQEVRQRQRVQRMFERYVSPKLVEEILKGGENPLERFSRLEVVAMFADMRGFTQLSERFEPRKVVQLLNDFFGLVTAIAYSFEGTVFNMAGDSLLVGFGVPLAQPDAAARALETGRTMISRFRMLAADWKMLFGVEAGLGVGIARGMVIAGSVGAPTHMSYTIIGDAVNVAARLMQHAKPNEILISEPVLKTAGKTAQALNPQPLPPMLFKGKSAPMPVYCIRVEEAARS
jgi:adenylate cyclase